MKYSAAKAALGQKESHLFLDRSCPLQRARRIVGGESTLRLLRKAGWLKAVREGKRKTVFNQREVHEAFARLTAQGYTALLKEAA